MSTDDLMRLRHALVERVRTNAGSVSQPVAAALGAVPRHLFVPEVPPEVAYRDDSIATKRDEHGQAISSSSQPTIMAVMLDQLGLTPGQRVLEIGAGTGYNAALISHLVGPGGEVVSIDIDPGLVLRAREHLARAGCSRVQVVCRDGAEGFAARAPYDRIIATVGVSDLAPAWLAQLAPDGRLVVPLGIRGAQRSVAFERQDGHWVSRSAVPCGFMRLRGSLAGPERTQVLDTTSGLAVMVVDGEPVDPAAMLAALDSPPTVRSTGAAVGGERILTDLGLWLATQEPRWCMVSESVAASGPRLSSAPVTVQDTSLTVGLRSADAVAVLATGGPAGRHLLTRGHGPSGEELAGRLAGHVSAWDRAGRPGEDVRISAHPQPVRDGGAPGGIVIDRPHHRLIVSWPTGASS